MLMSSLAPEFSCPVNIPLQALQSSPIHFKASSEECKKLAERFQLEALKRFEFTLFFLPEDQPQTYSLKGNFEADVLYTCVKTLEPFENFIHETIFFKVQEFSSAEENVEDSSIIFTGEEDIVEKCDPNGFLDVGEIMAQYLSLALDDYPEHPKKTDHLSFPSDSFSTSFLNQKNPSAFKEDINTSTYLPFKNLSSLKEKKPSS